MIYVCIYAIGDNTHTCDSLVCFHLQSGACVQLQGFRGMSTVTDTHMIVPS